jgi:hypothetical protein
MKWERTSFVTVPHFVTACHSQTDACSIPSTDWYYEILGSMVREGVVMPDSNCQVVHM